jgi:hypothetical protein
VFRDAVYCPAAVVTSPSFRPLIAPQETLSYAIHHQAT